MAKIDGFDNTNDEEEVEAFVGPDGFLYVLESLDELKEKELDEEERSM